MLFLLLACKPTPYQLGLKAADDGRYLEASQLWIRALDKDTTQAKPRSALLEYGPKAYEQLLDEGREHEASSRYREAITSFDGAVDFANELGELDLLQGGTLDDGSETISREEIDLDDIKQEKVSVRERWAAYEWRSAVAADEAADWPTAMTHFTTFRELRPDHSETDQRQGLAYLLWAEDDLANKRYTDSAEHYRQAHALTERESLAAWAGAIEVALGRYGLSKDKCRYAAERFRAAGKVAFDPALDEDRTRAEACARVGIELTPLEEQVQLTVEDTAVSSMLMDKIEREIERQGSRYLVLMVGEQASLPERRVQIGGRLTQAVVDAPTQATDKKTVEGHQWVPCDKETLLYEPDAVCSEPVDLTYTLNRSAQTVRMAATVKIVDAGTQRTRPLELTLHHDATHASGFQVYDGAEMVDVQIHSEVDENRVEAPPDLLALNRPPEPLPSGSEVLQEAVDVLASEAGRVVVEAIDHEDPPPEPTYLKVRDPLTLPVDLEFTSPTLAEPQPVIEATIESIPAPAPLPVPETPVPETPEETP